MDFSDKKIGIWGYGIVGKAACEYMQQKTCSLSTCDQKELSPEIHAQLNAKNIRFYPQTELLEFLESHDYIIPSPGIDLRPYSNYASKWLNELDIFASHWQKQIIAITGTVGKTTVTHLIGLLLNQAHISCAVGGNIGIGMLSLLEQQKKIEYAVLELSSWQLEYTTLCAPTIALWTNLVENHLDRHETLQNYFNAKYKIIAHQTESQKAIVPLELMDQIYQCNPKSRCIFFNNGIPDNVQCNKIRSQDTLFYFYENAFYIIVNNRQQCIAKNIPLPEYSFENNWILISALLYTLDLPLQLINKLDVNTYAQPHRLELIGTYNNIAIYNDSKSTTIFSTLASINKFIGKRIHLFLGGLSKGVDRTPLIKALQNKNISVYCFGKEANILNQLCSQFDIDAHIFATLEPAVIMCIKNCRQGDIILFSPAGSSYDLFNDYCDRGKQFKKLIFKLFAKSE